jgi:cytochrome c
MKSIVISVIAAAGLMVAGSAMAVTPMSPLATKHKCNACHKVDTKLVGPAYKDVAKKYKGDKGAEARLIAKVSKGGVGVWGKMPMPPNAPKVPAADIKELVKWVLSL